MSIQFAGIKFICERADGAITTWHTTFDKDPCQILKDVMHVKGWIGGRITEAYIDYQTIPYIKAWLDVEKNGFNKILNP
jgi:hypothetical protein